MSDKTAPLKSLYAGNPNCEFVRGCGGPDCPTYTIRRRDWCASCVVFAQQAFANYPTIVVGETE